MIEFGHGTHVGLRRRCNEDTYYADPALGLFLVADGLGGRRHGELAAALARDAVVTAVAEGAQLESAIRRADRDILARRSALAAGSAPMGTTLAALRLDTNAFQAAWVGDSHLFVWHGGLLRLGHSPAQLEALQAAGLLQAEPAADSAPGRPVVTQALGVTAAADLCVAQLRGGLLPGCRFLLCSDGLADTVGEASIGAIIGRDDLAAQEVVDQLILAALDAGGPDNVSAVLVRVRR